MDVRVDGGPQDGTILVTWIPSSTHGLAARQAPVTGYAVFADGKRVTDVDSPTSKNQFNYHDLSMHWYYIFHQHNNKYVVSATTTMKMTSLNNASRFSRFCGLIRKYLKVLFSVD